MKETSRNCSFHLFLILILSKPTPRTVCSTLDFKLSFLGWQFFPRSTKPLLPGFSVQISHWTNINWFCLTLVSTQVSETQRKPSPSARWICQDITGLDRRTKPTCTMAKQIQSTYFGKLTREILCSYTDLTVLTCFIYSSVTCLKTSKEKGRGQFGYTERKRAQMHFVAVERNWSLVIWNKYLNPGLHVHCLLNTSSISTRGIF